MKNQRLFLGVLLGVLIGIVIGVSFLQFAQKRACPAPVCVDSANVIPVSDRGYFQQVHNELLKARSSIHLVVFELKYYPTYSESSENIIVQDLIDAKKRGLDVRIIVDEYSKENNAFDFLKGNGIGIVMDTENVTTHAKLVVVDGKVVILGSTNFSYYALEKNNEVDVIIRDEKTAEYFEKYFDDLWKEFANG